MNQKRLQIILLITLVVVLAGVVSYYGYLKKSAEVTTSLTPTPATEETTTLETANSKTYKNEKFDYSIDIPQGWGQIYEYDGSYHATIDANAAFLTLGSGNNDPKIVIGVDENNPNTTFTIDWYINFYFKNRQYQREMTHIGGREAIGLSISVFDGFQYTYLIENSNRLYEISLHTKDNLTDKILSTFKFTK